MERDTEQQLLALVQELRDGQREMVAQLKEQRALAETQLERSRTAIAESVALQREALRRQRNVTLVAVPGILACIAAIGWLVLRYF